MTDLGTPTLIWVCVDCMLVHANGETGNDTLDREPWALWPNSPEVITMGQLPEEHAEDCTVKVTGAYPPDFECSCDTNTFSTLSCDGCGSTLHGERYAFTAWSE